MSMYEWAAGLSDERNLVRKQRARSKRLASLNTELFAVLHDLLGDKPDIQSGDCIRCGRDYRAEPELEGGNCPGDDCPGYRARQLCARARGGAQ